MFGVLNHIGKIMYIIKEAEFKYKKLLQFNGTQSEYTLLIDFLSELNFKSGRSPKGLTKEIENIKFLERQIQSFHDFYFSDAAKAKSTTDNIKAVFSRWDESTLELIYNKLSGKENNVLELSCATFINESIMSNKAFKETSIIINNFLKTLKGFHSKVLKNLKIVYVKKEQTKAAATYKTDKDIILIRPDKVTKGEEYGSFLYVILHELGHRYLRFNKVKFDYTSNEWITTKYSRTDSWSDEEKFAELFALSHFNYTREPFNDYQNKINKFRELM